MEGKCFTCGEQGHFSRDCRKNTVERGDKRGGKKLSFQKPSFHGMEEEEDSGYGRVARDMAFMEKQRYEVIALNTLSLLRLMNTERIGEDWRDGPRDEYHDNYPASLFYCRHRRDASRQ
jgi:hypothetical protein